MLGSEQHMWQVCLPLQPGMFLLNGWMQHFLQQLCKPRCNILGELLNRPRVSFCAENVFGGNPECSYCAADIAVQIGTLQQHVVLGSRLEIPFESIVLAIVDELYFGKSWAGPKL
ncbi:hypothetical protein A9C11_29980 [Pseudomonas citronellolis]|uniref:Uncharacterized protein n=1 Tax=Pseudomonas citronellolis TaxID=53408 RepID=A0A1A9KK91_9PSED|nr:hypothetical protein A9C11_29980 [Pseudomonas citronellolis]